MRINELQTEYEKHRVIMYNVNGDKAVYHNKNMRKLTDGIYVGEPENDGYNNWYCNIYGLFDETNVGIYIDYVRVDYSVDEVMERLVRGSVDTLEHFLQLMERKIAADDHIQLTAIEYIKNVKPEMEKDMWESRKRFAEKKAARNKEREEQRKRDDEEYITRNNKESEDKIKAALEVIRTHGTLQNDGVVFYESRYDYKKSCVLNYLFDKYGIKLPIRTRGFVSNNINTITIRENGSVSYTYWKHGNSRGSNAIYECIFKLIDAVKGENND